VSQSEIQAIVGLGNPGDKYEHTRHNVGFWLLDELARAGGGTFKHETKLMGEVCQLTLAGQPLRLLKPQTFMNESGQSMRRFADYFKLKTNQILVCHDELDLPPGVIRYKQGGGHGGHNGLRSAIQHCGADFLRMRIGIGHPGHKDAVHGYVLHKPGKADEDLIIKAMYEAERSVPTLLNDGLQKASQELHTATPR